MEYDCIIEVAMIWEFIGIMGTQQHRPPHHHVPPGPKVQVLGQA